MNTAQLNVLLEKTSNWDKDERYMATNDLCTALSKDVKIDESMEQRICTAVLKQLDDQSNDVQSVAVKCLAIIIKKVHSNQIGDICKKLSSLILDGKDALRDIYSIGLKTLIADVPESMGPLVAEKLTNPLISGVGRTQSEDIQKDCLDILTDLLKRFGHLNEKEHVDIMSSVVKQLDHDRPIIRKRASICLGALTVVSSENLLNALIQTLLGKIETPEKKSSAQDTRTLIQTIGTISRTVGHRLGKHLDRIVPLFLRFCGDPDDENMQNDESNELRENCFPGFESFVIRCPREVTPFIHDIMKVSIAFMKYDPNYAYDESEDNAIDMMNDDGDQEDDQDADQFDDDDYGGEDDDTSWKVRKAAVKVVSAIISSRTELLHQIYDIYGDEIIGRFKEREENVRLDIIQCFTILVQSTCLGGGSNSSSGSNNNAIVKPVTSSGLPPAPAPLVRQRSTVHQLEAKIQSIVNVSLVQLQGQSVKTKSAIFTLLRSTITALNGGLDKFINRLINTTEKSLIEKNQSLKLDALMFLQLAFEHHTPSILQSNIPKTLPLILNIIKEDWYKIIAEALKVLSVIITVLRPRDNVSGFFTDDYNFATYLTPIYQSIHSRLEILDIDQEIKERAILTMGKFISTMGDHLSNEIPTVLNILQKRLENETTRTATLKTIIMIASSSVSVNLANFLTNAAHDLSQFLRQTSRVLRQLTLQALDALVTSPKCTLTVSLTNDILTESAALISDSDLHLCQLSLKLTLSILAKDKQSASNALVNNVYPKALSLAKSTLIQGASLTGLIQLFQEFAQAGLPKMSFNDIFTSLYNTSNAAVTHSNNPSPIPQADASNVVTMTTAASSSSSSAGEISKHALSNLSKCIAGTCSHVNKDILEQTINRFVKDLQQTSNEGMKQLALLCLGEIGTHNDLSSIPNIKKLILDCFDNTSEETKLAAAYTLGHVAVGNMNVFLPVVLQTVESNHQQYLLFVALKEVISVYVNANIDIKVHLNTILPVLLKQCQAEEDSVRNMVAECLGLLTSMLPEQIIPVLLGMLNQKKDDSDKLTHRMIANALRVSLSRSYNENMIHITRVMGQFLPLLDDSDLEVKRAALLMVNTAIHHNPDTIITHLSSYVLPRLLETLKIKLERTVDLGPFKHKVDDNLPLRKVSLTCIEMVLDTLPERLDITAIMQQAMPLLLADKDEIKLQSHQIITKLAAYAPSIVVGNVDPLIEPLEKTVNKKPSKDVAGGPEVERANEQIKSGLRAILSLNKLEDITVISRKWFDFMERLKKYEHVVTFVQAIENEKNFENY